MNQRQFHKRILQISFCVMGMLMAARFASAEVTLTQNDKFKVDLYGQVSRAVLYVNDGNEDEFYHVDNDHSSTRVGLKATAQATEKISTGAVMEFEYQSNPSNLVWQEDPNAKNETEANKFDKRVLDVFLSSPYGKITFGHGSTASDYSSEVDLSGTGIVGTSNVPYFAGGMRFFNNATGLLDMDPADSKKDTSINSVINNLDGLGRKDRLRYDSPKFAGFQLAASTYSETDDDAEDVALTYSTDLAGGAKAAAAISYVNFDNSNSRRNQYSGSASFLMGNGLNFTFAGGSQDRRAVNSADAYFYYGKIGYIANLFSIGTTNFSVDYGTFFNMSRSDDRADATGVQFVQNLKDWSTELYLGYRWHDLNRNDVTRYDYADIHGAMAGMRVKF